MECNLQRLLTDGGRDQRRVRLLARERQVHHVQMQSRGARHRRRRQSLESHVEFLGIHRRRRHHGSGCRRRLDGHGVHAVSSDGNGLAAQRARHSRHRGRARRRRHIEEHQERTVHVQLHPRFLQSRDRRDDRRSRTLVRRQAQQPPHPRFAAARRSRPGDQLGSQSRPRHAARRCLPGHRFAPSGRLHP